MSPPDCFLLCVLYCLTCSEEEGSESQTETVTSVTDSRVMEGENGRHGGRITFPFSPFSLPLADSEQLMKEQYDNLLFLYLVLPTVLSGLSRAGMEEELSQLQHGDLLALVENISSVSEFEDSTLLLLFLFFFIDIQYS